MSAAMGKWLTEILRPVVNKYGEHTLKDSFEFCDHIDEFSKVNNTKEMFMCSFDIKSLFTNIPLAETMP